MEQQVSGEQDALLGQPRDEISAGVCGVAGVIQLDPLLPTVECQAGSGGEHGWPAGDTSPVGYGIPERRAAVDDRVVQQPCAGVLCTMMNVESGSRLLP